MGKKGNSFNLGWKDGRLKERITIRMDQSLFAKVKANGNNPSDLIRAAVVSYLAPFEKEYSDLSHKISTDTYMASNKPLKEVC
ncbi:MAG: hypothetical protein V1702_00355 [Candidatus Woesearchaeota archaeon]